MGKYPWGVMGYANPGCKGIILWMDGGDGVSGCREAPTQAASMEYGARVGTAIRTWDFLGLCSGINNGTRIDETHIIGNEGLGQRRCLDRSIMGYEIMRLEK